MKVLSQFVVSLDALLPTATNFNIFLLLSSLTTSSFHVGEVQVRSRIMVGAGVSLFHLVWEGGREGGREEDDS